MVRMAFMMLLSQDSPEFKGIKTQRLKRDFPVFGSQDSPEFKGIKTTNCGEVAGVLLSRQP